jgi:DegV family protein with EDD domain
MNPIQLITDSTCDLSKELLQKHRIPVVPLFVNIGEDTYLDGVNLSPEQMYSEVKRRNLMPKTAAASPGMFVEVFQKALDQGFDILFIGIGSKFSATFQSAVVAKQILESDRIHLIDSANLSSGSGLLLLKAAGFRDAGDSIATIVEKIHALIPLVRTQFVINTMDYLHKGGRCSGMAALFGTLLKIKPIIKVVDGSMEVGKKPRGNIRVAIDLLVDEVLELKDRLDPDFLMITHSLAHDSAVLIIERLQGMIGVKNIIETEAGCVISSHCGEGCIGILYLLKA